MTQSKDRRTHAAAIALVAAVLLSACQDPNVLIPEPGQPAPGTGGFAEGVDGLLVGHRLMDAGEYEAALKAYRLAALEQGLNADILSAFGSASLKLGRLGQAERFLRQAIDEDDSFVPAWNNLGVTLEARGKFVEAREAFANAFLLDSGITPEIAQNLRRMDAIIANLAFEDEGPSDFRLVRRGNGRYLLLGNN